jgi:hypothetical protein
MPYCGEGITICSLSSLAVEEIRRRGHTSSSISSEKIQRSPMCSAMTKYRFHQPNADRLGDEVHPAEGAAYGGAGADRAAAGEARRVGTASALNSPGRFE